MYTASSDIFWIQGDPSPSLAIVLRPRGGDWLEDELHRMKRGGVTALISLLEEEEASELGLAGERESATAIGLSYLSYPIPDRRTPPDYTGFQQFVKGLTYLLQAGEHVGVHCRASIGRASITTACVLIQLGWSPERALAAIESARRCSVPDTPEQRDWILRYQVTA
jgi:protein-tyrosine phosphatase